MYTFVRIFYSNYGQVRVFACPFFCCLFIGKDDAESCISVFCLRMQLVDGEAYEDVIILDDPQYLQVEPCPSIGPQEQTLNRYVLVFGDYVLGSVDFVKIEVQELGMRGGDGLVLVCVLEEHVAQVLFDDGEDILL